MKYSDKFKNEYGRLPKAKERCPVTGLSRSGIIDLGEAIPGLLVRTTRPGCERGAVLIHYPTLMSWLEQQRLIQARKI